MATGFDHADAMPTTLRRFADGIRARDPVAAMLLSRCASDPDVLALVEGEPAWDVPGRVLAAARWLTLTGRGEPFIDQQDAWPSFRDTLLANADHVVEFVRQRPVQTNEVQRCYALLPIFLMLARQTGQPLDMLELGASAGLNLLWDHYAYEYAAGHWGPGDAALTLRGEEVAPVPRALLNQPVSVARRRGIDLRPLDVHNADDVAVLRSYTGASGQERLMRAIESAQDHCVELIAGDYLELLPELLRERQQGCLTVVYQTISTIYLTSQQRARLRAVVEQIGEDGPLAFISTPAPDEHGGRGGDYPIELALWPGGRRRTVARMDNIAGRLQWVG